MIYELKFSYYEDNSENNDEIIIAVYSSYKKAEIGKKKFSQQPRFKGKEEFLEINEYKINEAEWNEGFWRATKSYFIIKLLNNYMIEKEELKSEQLAVKDKQIEELNARLAESNAALVAAQQTAQAAQALHAGTIQKQLVEGSAACADQSEQEPQEKRKWWSKLFKG